MQRSLHNRIRRDRIRIALIVMSVFLESCAGEKAATLRNDRTEEQRVYIARVGIPAAAIGCFSISPRFDVEAQRADSAWLAGIVTVNVRDDLAGPTLLRSAHLRTLDVTTRGNLRPPDFAYWSADSASDSVRWELSDGFSSRALHMIPSANDATVGRLRVVNEARHDGVDEGTVTIHRATCSPLH